MQCAVLSRLSEYICPMQILRGYKQVLIQPTACLARLTSLALFSAGMFLSAVTSAVVPSPGTLISNTASSTQQVGALPQSSMTNNVAAVVGGAAGSLPVLSKYYSVASIVTGGVANLVFQLDNSAGQPPQSGITFVDTLPSGLRLSAGATASVSGVGCSAAVSFAAPSTISVSGGAMAANTATCLITINGVTNFSSSVLNSDCGANPAAFTNGATSISGLSNIANGVTNRCLVVVGVSTKPNLDMSLIKSITANSGASPSGKHTVRIRYLNVSSVDGRKTDVSVVDVLPSGMQLVPGSLRVSPTGGPPTLVLADSMGTFMAHGASATYRADANSVNVVFSRLDQGEWGLVEFDINIAAGIPVDTVLRNVAQVSYLDFDGKPVPPLVSSPAEFRITGIEAVILRGMTLPSVEPGSVAVFENLLTNNGARADTFDISLTGSNYPAGTIFRMFKADGVTPLSDNDGNGIADTGLVAAGATFKIIVKAQLPNGALGGPFSIAKNAQSVTNSLVKASDVDVVSAIGMLCRVTLEPNNVGTIGPGGSITYTHILTNVGNCVETITIPADFLNNLSPGWTAQIFVDNPIAGGQSIVGVLDAGDANASTATTITVPPGGRVLFLTRVSAPANAVNGASNTTRVRVVGGSSGILSVTDTTTVASGSIGNIFDEITGFIDPGFSRPTVWGFIGSPLYLRANAPSCNVDPTIVERRIIVITGPNGEREEIVATETGPNTGMFVAEPILIRLPPVIPDDRLLEGRPYDTFSVDLIGCGKKISTTVTLIDPNGVVFDSRTNQPVAGATARLLLASGGTCSNTPATVSMLEGANIVPAPSVVTTGPDGRFSFPLVAPGDYCVRVTPPNGYTWISTVPFTQLPPGRNILATGPTSGGSYGGRFNLGLVTGPVILDIPVDGGLIGGLFVQKTVLRSIVEIGEFLDYGVEVKNNTGYALNQADVLLNDVLPAGFTFARGSARIDGKPLADPQGGTGPRLTFNLGRMAKDQQVRISYRVRVGPGAMQGDGINRVVASYRPPGGSALFSESNVAAVKVTVVGGVFTDRGYIVGKVFADCDNDGVQSRRGADGEREIGVPGIRFYLEDGTNVVTDAEGKFSFYGLLPRTHVLKIDRTTLPAGVEPSDLATLSSRNLGKGDSRIVDLKKGELHKADFAIKKCSGAVIAEIGQRRKSASSQHFEIDGRLQQRLETDPNLRTPSDIKALPATGLVGTTAPTANISAPTPLGGGVDPIGSVAATPAATSRFDSLSRFLPDILPKPIIERKRVEPEILLENVLPLEDNSLGFIGIKEADIFPFAQTTIRVKGAAGAMFKLQVNGKDIADDRVGKRAVFAERQSQAWEFLGVNLVVGENVLLVRQFDSFGNARGEKSIRVVAPVGWPN